MAECELSRVEWLEKLNRAVHEDLMLYGPSVGLFLAESYHAYRGAIAVLNEHAVLNLGPGPYVVLTPWQEEVPGIEFNGRHPVRTMHLEHVCIKTPNPGPHSIDFNGRVTLYSFMYQISIVELHEYADGGPPSMYQVMRLRDFEKIEDMLKITTKVARLLVD